MGVNVTGAILAGGNSSRMGRDKALLLWNGKPLIMHVAETLHAMFHDVRICGGTDDRYGFLGLPVLPDLVPQSGPLGGIHSALSHSVPASVFVLSCDMPLVSCSLIEYILEFPSSAPMKVAALDGRLQPLCGVYHTSCLPVIGQELKHRRLKLTEVFALLNGTPVPIGPDLSFYDERLMMNVNDEQAYRQLTAWHSPDR
jgi:molybdopterin-guanine dinucleotide biosynthesis protein A